MSRTTIMIIGLGDLGGHVLELVARAPGYRRIITADVNEDWGYRKTNIVGFGAAQMGYYPDLEFTKIDVNNIEQTAEIVSRYKPEVIYSAVTLQSWWVINTLPQEIFDRLDKARFGPWLPMHLALVYKLMRAVKQTGLGIKVINSAFPDAVGPVLATRGLAPACGIGNVANPVPPIRASIAFRLGRPVKEVAIYFVCQHYVSHYLPRFGTTGGAPYYLKALIGGRDVTRDVDLDEVFADLPKRFRRPGGRLGQILTASSAAAITLAMADDSHEFTHAPGPGGLPGGYPVLVTGEGAKVELPGDISLEKAIDINEKGQQADGIERIDKDGTVTYCDWSVDIMKEMVGYDRRVMKLDEVDDCADELGGKFKEFASRYQ